MINNRWLPFLAPVTAFTVASILAVGLAVLFTMAALSRPWLGVVFDRSHEGEGVLVEQVIDNGPAAGKLSKGDIIKLFIAPGQGTVEVNSLTTLEDPDYLDSYAEFNKFVNIQQQLWDVISMPSFTMVLGNGIKVELQAAKYPGVTALSATYWWLLLFGAASFLLGVSVWCLRRSEPVTQVLAISGMGFMVASYSCGLYVTREIAIPAKYMFGLVSLSHLGLFIFTYAVILAFWYYPRKLGTGPVAWLFSIWGALLWLNETLQWLSWPGHPYYSHFLVAYSILFTFTFLQWRKSSNAPLERAMLKWMLGTMSVTLGFTVILFCIPIMVTGKPVTSTSLTFGSVFVFFLGLVIGNIRYQQFGLEHWWFRAWQWLLFILIALVADSIFVYILQVNNTISIGLSIAAGCVYLMARQWFWNRYSGNNRRGMDHALPHLLDVLMIRQQKWTPDQQWQQLVERVFDPLSVKIFPDKRDTVTIEQSGLALQLPSLDGTATIEIFCCDRGKRLFGFTDIKLSRRLLELMLHSRDVITAHEQGAQEERHRIQRDLHDDVAARLLSLLHQTREPAISKVASNALRGLRDVIHLLGAEEEPLEDVMTDIEAGAREQLAGLGIHFEWQAPESWPGVMLSSQQHINLRRIARETIANALKHASPASIIVQVEIDEKELGLRICNDGINNDPSKWIPGRGLNNIKSRVAELGGSHKWGIEQIGVIKQYCYLAVRIPLTISENPQPHPADRRL